MRVETSSNSPGRASQVVLAIGLVLLVVFMALLIRAFGTLGSAEGAEKAQELAKGVAASLRVLRFAISFCAAGVVLRYLERTRGSRDRNPPDQSS